MTRPEHRRAPPRPRVHPPRPSPENQDRAAGSRRQPAARPPRRLGQRRLPQSGPQKRRAIFPWFFLAVQVLFLILVIAAALAGHGTAETVSRQVARACLNGAWQGLFRSQRACLEHFHVTLPHGQNLDPGLGPGLVAIAWVVADACLGLGYCLYRLARSSR